MQVVVGDEILAARVEDVNTRFLCRELRALGWRVCKARSHASPACLSMRMRVPAMCEACSAVCSQAPA